MRFARIRAKRLFATNQIDDMAGRFGNIAALSRVADGDGSNAQDAE